MLRSIATICVNGTLRTKLRAIADAGFEHVEIFESDLLACPEPVAVVGAMLRDQGLACAAFQPFRDFEGMPTRLRARVFDRAERKFDVMEELGTDLVLVTSNVSPESLGERGRIVDDLRELGDRAAARGLRVGFEALAWGRHVNDHRQAWEIVREVDHRAVGLVLDSFSSLARNMPIESLQLDRPGEAVPRPARRCAVAVDGSAVVEPALPLHAGAGRPAAGGVRGGASQDRLSGCAVARDLQRPLSRGLCD